MEKTKSLKNGIILNLLRSLMGIIFPLISFPYASRILLPEGIGKVNFANSIIDYFLIIASLGITTYATREAAAIKNDKDKLSSFCKEMLIINFFSTLVSVLLFLISLIFIKNLHDYKTLLLVCSIKILFFPIGIDWLYIAKEDFFYITVRSFLFQLLSIVLLFLFVKDSSHFIRYAALGVFSNVGSNICNLINAGKIIDFRIKISNIKKHFKPIFIFFGSSCAAKIQNAIDTIMLGFLAGNIEVGLYSAAIKLVKISSTLLTTVSATLLPRSSFYVTNKAENEYNLLINKAINITVFFAVPLSFGLFFLTDELIKVFCGEEYLDAINTMKIIIPSIIFAAIGSLIDTLIFIPQKKEKLTLIFQIINCFLNIFLNFLLISHYGAFGAALSTMIVEFINMVLKISFSIKFFINKNILFSFFKTIFVSCTMYLMLHFICIRITNSFIKILFSTIIGSLIYAGGTILLRHTVALLLINTINRTKKG